MFKDFIIDTLGYQPPTYWGYDGDVLPLPELPEAPATSYDSGTRQVSVTPYPFRALNYAIPHDDANLIDVEMRYATAATGGGPYSYEDLDTKTRTAGWTVVSGLRLNVINQMPTTITIPAGEQYWRVQFRHQFPERLGRLELQHLVRSERLLTTRMVARGGRDRRLRPGQPTRRRLPRASIRAR